MKKFECKYTDEQVRRLLSYMFNGEVSYQEAETPEPGMPRAKNNPAHSGDQMAEMVDIKRTWDKTLPMLAVPGLLVEVFGRGRLLQEIADQHQMDREIVKKMVDADVDYIVRTLNGESLCSLES